MERGAHGECRKCGSELHSKHSVFMYKQAARWHLGAAVTIPNHLPTHPPHRVSGFALALVGWETPRTAMPWWALASGHRSQEGAFLIAPQRAEGPASLGKGNLRSPSRVREEAHEQPMATPACVRVRQAFRFGSQLGYTKQ